jgi:glycosyltransferase involved in cell wall biosynthesis
MKIVIVNAFDLRGGASRAAYRLHQSLIKIGVDSHMLVQFKLGEDPSVITENNPFILIINKFISYCDRVISMYSRNQPHNFSLSWFKNRRLINKINQLNPDIVHLHWICNGMMSIEDIQKIQAPIAWSLHDNWPFSGGCHVMKLCKEHNYITHDCSPGISNSFARKNLAFSQKEMKIIGLSNWINTLSLNSPLLGSKEHINLPNPIDTNFFQPVNKIKARKHFGFNSHKKIILLGALNALTDQNKGFELLISAMQSLNSDIFTLVILNESSLDLELGIDIHTIKPLKDDGELNKLYSAVDIVAVPSLQENLSNTILESMSVGIPVVAFDIGGNSDLIVHNATGYLAEPFNVEDLAHGIEVSVSNENHQRMSISARRRAIKYFDNEVVANRYKDFYEGFVTKNQDNA